MSPNTDNNLGELLRRELSEICVVEDEEMPGGWAGAQARRVAQRLNVCRTPRAPLEPVVFWSPRVNAFTTPGPYIFITRELLQRLPHDAAVAFVIAHEMAHQDLRHLGALGDSSMGAVRTALEWTRLAAAKLAHNPENEVDADRYALQLCMQAGYQGAACLEAFRILIAYTLDWHDLDGVFGPDDGPPTGKRTASWRRLKHWWWERGRGYLSLERRRELLEQMLRDGLDAPPAECVSAEQVSSPFRSPLAPAQAASCAGCGRETVPSTGHLCTSCQRHAAFSRRVARAVHEERRRFLVVNWGRLLLVVVLVVATMVAAYVGRSYLPSSPMSPPPARARDAVGPDESHSVRRHVRQRRYPLPTRWQRYR
jgi:hypothetical protein